MTTRGWLWLSIVVILFCVPLFVNLHGTDVQSDEAIYSFAVDRIIETGDWRVPKASPVEDLPFLEKPPLKFWITSLPIRAGVLPLDEFSLRLTDAIFGAAAFVYVFALGLELVAPIAGVIAVLMLFTYTPLLFDHGLRTNGMDAALVLAYAGGVYHYFRWRNADPDDAAVRHAIAVGLYTTLGLLTKFVAVFFLPLILVSASLPFAAVREKVLRAWRTWAGVALGVLVLGAPWFVYMGWQFGPHFWQAILGQQVYQRFTTYLDPGHVQPWSFYWRAVYSSFFYPRSVILIVAGFVILAFESLKRRWFEGTTVLLWFALPLWLLSIGTSKLIHYAHPFVLALALAAGYAGTLVLWLGPAPLDRLLTRRPLAVRLVLLVIAGAAMGLALDSALHGDVRWQVSPTVAVRNSSVLRPILIALACGAAASLRRPGRAVASLLLLLLLPLPAYASTIQQLRVENHPLRDVRDCLLRLQSEPARASHRGMYVSVPTERMAHPVYYYFRRVRPWTRASSADAAAAKRELGQPSAVPALVVDETRPPVLPSGVATERFGEIRLLLPGDYAVCAERTPVR